MTSRLSPLPFAPVESAGSGASPRFSAMPVSSGAATAGSAQPAALPPIPGMAGSGYPSWPDPEMPARRGDLSETPPRRVDNPPAQSSVNPNDPVDEWGDGDLRDAIAELLGGWNPGPVQARVDAAGLEPMLRSVVRRALAEHVPSTRPFQQPRSLDRLVWQVQGLFSSRSYEEILFEKTRRFQVHEVFLFDGESLALISFASCDPARHASARRVADAAHRVALMIRNSEVASAADPESDPDEKVEVVRGRFCVLAARMRGLPDATALDDLRHALERIEERFASEFRIEGSELLHRIQPFLEECLLIQCPVGAI